MLTIDQVHTLKTTDIILQNLTVASEEGIPMTLFPHKVPDIIQSQGIPSAPSTATLALLFGILKDRTLLIL